MKCGGSVGLWAVAALELWLPVQLSLPMTEAPESVVMPIPRSRRVFVNRDLKLARCAWVGFDMDYTLVIYHQQRMDELSIRATVDKLIARGYPPFLAQLDYPLDFAIRGLLIDKHLGNVLKLNRFKIVRRGYHGLHELTRNDLRALYYERKLRHKSSRYHWIDTLYGLSEASAYAAIVQAFETRKQRVRYSRLFNDIRECIDLSHRDGSILDVVMQNPGLYVERDEQLAPYLHKLRSSGKKLFLLTNSHWPYSQVLMSYLLDDALPDYGGFQQYFDIMICAARKPVFFEHDQPMLERRGDALVPARLPLVRGVVYQGGNIAALQQALGVTGNHVMYVGDHIYGDMLRSKKDSAWRTAMIIPELEAEVMAHEACRSDFQRAAELYNGRYELEDKVRHYAARLKKVERHPSKNGRAGDGTAAQRIKHLLGASRRQLRSLDRSLSDLRRRVDRRFHPYWGSLLKEGYELSLFGHQVDAYSCIYSSRVSNLTHYSAHQYFRSPHNQMHHEL